MFGNDRDGAIALGLAIAFLAVFFLGLWAGTDADSRAHYAASEQNNLADANSTIPIPLHDMFWLSHNGSAASYEALCNQPIDNDQADLCQQWRSAERAGEVSWLTKLQLILSVAGVVGLVITVHYSRKATLAAVAATELSQKGLSAAEHGNRQSARSAIASQDAADAAIEANRIAREIGEAQIRGYILVTGHSVGMADDGLYFHVHIKNVTSYPVKQLAVRYLIKMTIPDAGQRSYSDFGEDGRTALVLPGEDVAGGETAHPTRRFDQFQGIIAAGANPHSAIRAFVEVDLVISYSDLMGHGVYERQTWSGPVAGVGEGTMNLKFENGYGLVIDRLPKFS